MKIFPRPSSRSKTESVSTNLILDPTVTNLEIPIELQIYTDGPLLSLVPGQSNKYS